MMFSLMAEAVMNERIIMSCALLKLLLVDGAHNRRGTWRCVSHSEAVSHDVAKEAAEHEDFNSCFASVAK
jgi:hypothetical protein